MRESFEPHRALWHVLAIVLGGSAFIVPPQGLAALVDPVILGIWASALLLSGIGGLVAPLTQPANLGHALAVERAALWIQTGTLIWIIVSALYYRGVQDGAGVIVYLGWAVANVLRDHRIASAVTKAEGDPGE